MLSYPLAFLWAAGGVVPALYSFPKGALETLSQDDAVRAVVRRLAVPSLAIWILVHLLSLPWALGTSRRNTWIFAIGVGTLASLAIVGGGGAWIWLYTR